MKKGTRDKQAIQTTHVELQHYYPIYSSISQIAMCLNLLQFIILYEVFKFTLEW
jgi:hypothetical protein